MNSRVSLRARIGLALALAIAPAPALALEVATLYDRTLRLDITATTVAAYHLDNRNSDVTDDDYFDLFNRINVQLSYWRLTASARLDTATFVDEPEAAELALANATDPNDADEVNRRQNTYWATLRSRHRDAYWLGKAFLTYSSPNLDVTAGDAYVSFGRGLVLSMRKQDELAVDNTLLGGKVTGRLGWFSGTLVAGVANPVRVDEATGQSLFAVSPSQADLDKGITEVPNFHSDQLFGARLEGNWSGYALGLQGVHMIRPATMGETSGIRGASTIDNAGASLNLPFPSQLGAAYLEGAYQRASGVDSAGADYTDEGYALYGSVNAARGPLTAVIDLQHYRNFSPLYATTHATDANTFRYLAYSTPPTTEPVTNDTRPNFFDLCVTGGRGRLNGRISDPLMVYGTFGYWATWGERVRKCFDAEPGTRQRNNVYDGTVGVEWFFDAASSHLFASAGLRHDTQDEDGVLFYREVHLEGSFVKAITGPWSVELDARWRRRFNRVEEFVKLPSETVPSPWQEGDFYLALKYSPYLVATLGFEFKYTELRPEEPLTTYFNGSVLVKYRSDSSVRLFAGQQRGALKCVSGVCRQFPPFEGVKLEWTQRY